MKDTDAIQNFILRDERNFRTAVAVREAWPKIRNHIANGFMNRLSESLLKELPGWSSEIGEDFYDFPWVGTKFFKPSWNDEYWVMLQFIRQGQEVQFGVQRNKHEMAERPFNSEILERVVQVQPSAKVQKEWWEAHVLMRNPAPNWQEPEVLWRMHTDQRFLDEVAYQLLEVAKAAEPILDRLTKKN